MNLVKIVNNVFQSIVICLLCALSSLHSKEIQGPSFKNGFNRQRGEILARKSLYRDCNRLYSDYLNFAVLEDNYIIPPIIHFIWLGSAMPERCQRLISICKELHPDWTVNVWTDKEAETYEMINAQAFKDAVNYGQKSDIWRYEILHQYGGLYLDTDMECIKPFDKLHKSCSFYSGISRDGTAIYNGLIGVSPGHPIMKACIEQLNPEPGQEDYNKIMKETGPYFFGKVVNSIAHSCPLGSAPIFPPIYFYPYPGIYRRKLDDIAKDKFCYPQTMAIHYWATSWQKDSD